MAASKVVCHWMYSEQELIVDSSVWASKRMLFSNGQSMHDLCAAR